MIKSNNPYSLWLIAALFVMGAMALVMPGFVLSIPGSPIVALFHQLSDWLFATSSVQALWYVTRAAGLVAYLLFWLSTVWGLAVSSKIFDPVLQRFFTHDMHQFISLLAIGFIILHVVVLLADRYMPFSVAQILVPFIAPYRPVWVGLGVIGLYLTLLVSITFYIRQRIGYRTFHVIHLASFAAYILALVHGWMSGTDSTLGMTQAMYAVSALAVIFLLVYRILILVFPYRPSRPIQPRSQGQDL
jgi:methionine sulfoxide reductase heme-binding subunit